MGGADLISVVLDFGRQDLFSDEHFLRKLIKTVPHLCQPDDIIPTMSATSTRSRTTCIFTWCTLKSCLRRFKSIALEIVSNQLIQSPYGK